MRVYSLLFSDTGAAASDFEDAILVREWRQLSTEA